MDDHPQTASQNSLQTDDEPVLDAVTEELKHEFARLEQLERLEATTRELEGAIGTKFNITNSIAVSQHLSDALAKLCYVIDSIEAHIGVFGYTRRLQQKLQFWTDVFRAIRAALAKLSALLAHSLLATLRTPLPLDGPELSGYKHRLR